MRRLLLLIAALLCMASVPAGSPVFDVHLKEVRSYIDYFHRHTGQGMRSKVRIAKERIAPVVVEHSINQGIDPLLTSVIISFESSWRPGSRGGLKEVGLMQVMRPAFEPKNYVDEIIIGTRRLKLAVNSCKDIQGALTHYGSGVCKPRTALTKNKMSYRFRMYKNAVKIARYGHAPKTTKRPKAKRKSNGQDTSRQRPARRETTPRPRVHVERGPTSSELEPWAVNESVW